HIASLVAVIEYTSGLTRNSELSLR
ncbi:MAG: hypothetical protein QOH07_1317, partial [Mycobacterium sp.]|nr:hypothetical protein [Mycobacterium sp.]